MGWDGCALLVQPSVIPHKNSKILFVLGSYEYLERLEGKIRKCLFNFISKYSKITVWTQNDRVFNSKRIPLGLIKKLRESGLGFECKYLFPPCICKSELKSFVRKSLSQVNIPTLRSLLNVLFY